MDQKPSILVVDDEQHIRSIVAEILDAHGYHVFSAASAMGALTLVEKRMVDAFLLDIDMPGMNGIELCRHLRSMDKFKLTPIIFVTAAVERVNVDEAFAAGCDDFIEKPFNHLILETRLRGRLEKMKYFQELELTRQALNRYVSKRTVAVVETSARTGVVPAPEDRDLAICFTDLRGFTAFSENIEPRDLFSLVSSCLAEQVTTVHRHGGYVDKFGGDGIMALFDGTNMVLQSCLCALRILESGKQTASSAPAVGIGIHTGRATIGNIGSPEHFDYSAIGQSVNLAARLCGQAEPGSIAVSRAVFDAVAGDPRLHFHSERSVTIKGLKDPVTVYTLSPAN